MKIEVNFIRCNCEHCRGRKHPRHRIVGRFAGAYYVNQEGVLVVMSQQVPGSQVSTAPLIFTQDGAVIKGPVGEVLSSDPTVIVALSADGQAVNFTSPATAGTFTLKWHIADASVAPFTIDVVVAVTVPPPPPPILGSFGTIVAGTTP